MSITPIFSIKKKLQIPPMADKATDAAGSTELTLRLVWFRLKGQNDFVGNEDSLMRAEGSHLHRV
jgi:hypothetical protein